MNNVSKNIDSQGRSITPSAYKIRKIELFNHRDEMYEIQNIVVKLVITESIYSDTLICKVSIKDETNLMQEFPLIGQEKVRVLLRSRSKNDDKDIDLTFHITEYPLYGRGKNERTQAFAFTGISEHAYLSRFKQISRAVSGNTSDIIADIFSSDLSSDKFVNEKPPISVFKGIINTQHPLAAAEWLRKKTYDDDLSPYYLFETLHGEVHLKSHSELVSQEPYFDYVDARNFNYDPNTQDDYLQRKHRILNITSDLKMGKIFDAGSGAYASKNFYLDIANKTFTFDEFSYNIEENSLEKKGPFSTEFLIDNEPISKKYAAHHEYVSTNAFAFGNTRYNYNELKKNTMGRTKAYRENMESMTHDLQLFGDFDLNAGKVIEVEIPKPVDPEVQREMLKNTKYGEMDDHISGNYLITSAIHTFEKGEYFTSVKVKRDSFKIQL